MNPVLEREDQEQLHRNWDVFATHAWEEYTVQGRGALLVLTTGSPNPDTIFLPLKMLLGNPLGQEYVGLVREYDPRCEIVVIFMRPACSRTAYKVSMAGRETPPQAYERLNRQLSPPAGRRAIA